MKRSRVLPLVWVGKEISCERLKSERIEVS